MAGLSRNRAPDGPVRGVPVCPSVCPGASVRGVPVCPSGGVIVCPSCPGSRACGCPCFRGLYRPLCTQFRLPDCSVHGQRAHVMSANQAVGHAGLTGVSLVTGRYLGVWAVIATMCPFVCPMVHRCRASVWSPVVRICCDGPAGDRYDPFCGLINA